MIRLNRVTCGIVAGTAGILAGAVSVALAPRMSPSLRTRLFAVVFVAVAAGVFGLADWLGVLAAPYEKPRDVLSINADEDKTTRTNARRKR
jgi:hypothetical protein